ncbi:MAG: ribonuclease D [Phycisphaerae bacterium]
MNSGSLKLPAISTKLVDTPEELSKVCAHLQSSGRFAFDTEFIGENTYQPILCLVQVATDERVDLIDPMTLAQTDENALQDLWQLLADERLEKICHAGDQDVEIVWQHSGLVTKNMFDTQIGAGMLGIAYPTALWRAVEHFAGVTLEKAHTYSAWDRRPLSKSQLAYAVDDVRYLPFIHDQMKKRIEELQHMHWMRLACDEMCTEAAKPADARRLYTRIRGAPGLSSEQLSVLREVTALREQIAFEADLPARQVLKDEPLLDIATRMPDSLDRLKKIRDLPPDLADSYGEDFLDAVQRGRGIPEADRPTILIPGEDLAEVKRLGETLWVAAQVICLGQSVTPGLVTSQNEVLALARMVHKRKPLDRHPLMHGWHAECLGQKLAQFIRGELQIDVTMSDLEMRAAFDAIKHKSSK